MGISLAIPKGKIVAKPVREPDYYSKRHVAYWWSPEWVRATSSANTKFSRIYPHKVRYQYKKYEDDEWDVELYMLSKTGNETYIRGSIQAEFVRWHLDNEIDYILLGIDISEVLATNWEYE